MNPEPQAALNKIVIVENNEPLVDLRDLTSNILFQDTPGHVAVPFLRKTVAEMLKLAAEKISADYNLYVLSALRDIDLQTKIWNDTYARNKAQHPNWPENILVKMTNKFVAPVNHSAPPGHTTGGAVDVVLRRKDGGFVDLLPQELVDWRMAETASTKVGSEVQIARKLLLQTMLSVGFSNCSAEYWHYSWGDSAWAVRLRRNECCYGAVSIKN